MCFLKGHFLQPKSQVLRITAAELRSTHAVEPATTDYWVVCCATQLLRESNDCTAVVLFCAAVKRPRGQEAKILCSGAFLFARETDCSENLADFSAFSVVSDGYSVPIVPHCSSCSSFPVVPDVPEGQCRETAASGIQSHWKETPVIIHH